MSNKRFKIVKTQTKSCWQIVVDTNTREEYLVKYGDKSAIQDLGTKYCEDLSELTE